MPEAAANHRPKRCPICGKPAPEQFRPFCGQRCRDIDLNRWLSNAYVLPGKPEEEEDERPATKFAGHSL
jgi:endogenous inhibitor of DNA gyrase (YacG/DUF329 family)